MELLHLDLTKNKLKGPTKAQIESCNQWAATALDKFHAESNAEFEFIIDGKIRKAIIEWDSNFSKSAMKEHIDMANHGGVAMAWFLMSVMLEFTYVEQSEIGDGVDYRFKIVEPDDNDLNFLDDYHYVEISGILEETKSNTLIGRIKDKHNQIKKGGKNDKSSSVIVTLFKTPTTVKEIHK